MILNDIYYMINTDTYNYNDIIQELNKVFTEIEPLTESLDKDTIEKIDTVIATANETAFIQGFKMAIQLIKECKIWLLI